LVFFLFRLPGVLREPTRLHQRRALLELLMGVAQRAVQIPDAVWRCMSLRPRAALFMCALAHALARPWSTLLAAGPIGPPRARVQAPAARSAA